MMMVMITYNEAVDEEVMAVLNSCAMKNYTKLTRAFGKGIASGTHLGDDIWPGLNNILYIACPEKEAAQILTCIKELRKTIGHEGVKAFSWKLEEIT